MNRHALVGFGLLGLLLVACSEEPIDPGEKDGAATLSIVPTTATLAPNARQPFVARDGDGKPVDVTWSVSEQNGGQIDANGLYIAPPNAGAFTVVATSRADVNLRATAQVTVQPADPETITVRVEPVNARVPAGKTFQFEARVTGTDDKRVEWKVLDAEGGSIDASGLYTAPDTEGTYALRATSVADPERSATVSVAVFVPGPIDLSILPEDRRTVWNPGIPGGIPRTRNVFTTLSGLTADGTGDNRRAIQDAIVAAGAEYEKSGTIQEVVLPAGTLRFTGTIFLSRSGVVLRGQGMDKTKLRFDGDGAALVIARARWGTYTSAHGPWPLARDAVRGSRTIVLSNESAAKIEVGDILCIDEEDDASFVRMGDARYEKRQPTADTNGPRLREAGRWRSVTTMIRVIGKTTSGDETTLTLADPLHMSFRTGQHAEVFHVATEYSSARPAYEGVHYAGIENLYVTGGYVTTNNAAFCWMDGLEVDGNPGTQNIGTYVEPGGITGRSVSLFHAYRCEIRNSYIHHSRNIAQGGGAYLLSISSYTSESLVEDNIVVFGNKGIVGNMMGGGNVIAYNYVDNVRTYHESWQEGAIDLNHQSFTHHALVEGNWATNLTSDTTHGNAGWHVFHRNHGTGQNSAPIYGPHPYISGNPDGQYRRAAGTDGYHREASYIGNVLHAGSGTRVYQVDHAANAQMNSAAVWRIGWGVDGGGGNNDDGTALDLLYRHGNWDVVTGDVVWDEANNVRKIPDSLYLTARPAFFGDRDWPWVDPTGDSDGARLKSLPAKERYDALVGN